MSDSVAHQAPLPMGFPRQEYWSGLLFPSPGDFPDPGIKFTSLVSPALAGRFFITSTTWETHLTNMHIFKLKFPIILHTLSSNWPSKTIKEIQEAMTLPGKHTILVDHQTRIFTNISQIVSYWRKKWQATPVFLPGESQGRGSLVGCRLWGRTESDTTEAT